MPPTTRAIAAKRATIATNNESDYGSDLDDDTITDLLEEAESQPLQSLVVESIEEHNPLPLAALVPNSPRSRYIRRTKTLIDEDGVAFEVPDNDGPLREPSVEVEYHEANRVAFFSPGPLDDVSKRPISVPSNERILEDPRSPLERFRTPPKKPMSVTDLVSPAWCELQYFYSLAKFGKVQKTPAMKQGSSVHKELEEEVHIAVPVDVVTREDMFGLRIWNIIQGLRTLRATGMTRELEVWGVLEGQVVNGVIDELSYTCPDKDFESALQTRKKRGRPKKQKEEAVSADQTSISDFLAGMGSKTSDDKTGTLPGTRPSKVKKIYITDIKTRGSNKAPSDPVSLRPTYYQLMLYRRLLDQLAIDAVPSSTVFARYNISETSTFSDTFISQIGNLDFNFAPRTSPPAPDLAPPFNSPRDSIDELLSHNTPAKLWTLMTSEFRATISPTAPAHQPQPQSSHRQSGGSSSNPGKAADGPHDSGSGGISAILHAEFRAASDGRVVGHKVFLADERRLDAYVREEMAWWRGERPAKGVEIEEAFKCRICAFAEGCGWRREREREVAEAGRKPKGRERSRV